MDKLEVIFNSSQISPVERINLIKQWKYICICPDCPTYNDCSNQSSELLFCFIGKSFHCISEENGCTCKQCPATATYGLMHEYYCTRGSEMAQRWFEITVSKK